MAAFDRIRSARENIYDGAEPVFFIPAPPVRLCDHCAHTLARRNPETICFCCQRKEAELKRHLDGLRCGSLRLTVTRLNQPSQETQ